MTELPATTALVERNTGIKALLSRAHEVVDISEEARALALSGVRVQLLINKVADDIDVAADLVVDSAEMLGEAQRIRARLAAVFGDSGEIEIERAAVTKPFLDVQRTINAGYKAPREWAQPVISRLDQQILAFHNEQQRKQREAAEKERQQREETARKAAEAEAEARATADRLMQASQSAQSEGASIAAIELQQQASVAMDAGRAAAVQAAQAAHVAAAPAAAKAKGVRERWSAELVNLEALVLHVAKRLAEGDRSLLPLLLLDQRMATTKASIEKEAMNVPGLRAVSSQSLVQARAATV
ncbi:hypothetical protein UFOVP703_11 [uncultured Caudovirales phage]|uniref:Uncharacterized protein n=1 Tax=uncultured Caudovirales phage TaxID=2100421 RepID=A0A6J5NL76_9CAUD|nr:hypothetical protein UFOVP703_11 [uncultured Caudovirales phage]